jgi:hypothetical protein
MSVCDIAGKLASKWADNPVGPDGWRAYAGSRGGLSGRRDGNEGAYKEGETSRRRQLNVERERKGGGQEKHYDRGDRRNGQGERVGGLQDRSQLAHSLSLLYRRLC